jgi:hypothetical protein
MIISELDNKKRFRIHSALTYMKSHDKITEDFQISNQLFGIEPADKQTAVECRGPSIFKYGPSYFVHFTDYDAHLLHHLLLQS